MKYRNSDIKLYKHLYRRHIFENDRYCFYCGDYMTCLDHVPPISIATDYIDIPHRLVSSCQACNTKLGARPLPTLYDRALYIAAWLERKYQKTGYVLWEEIELQEMSPEFQHALRARNITRDLLVRRAHHAAWRVLQTESFP